MSQFKHSYPIIFLFAVLLSCSDKEDGVIAKNTPIDIPKSIIPTSGTVNTDIPIEIRAQAPNGCFSDLEVNLIKKGDQDYLINAIADFESHGPCPSVVVHIDTTITFKPLSAGSYHFQVNEEPLKVREYTLVVN